MSRSRTPSNGTSENEPLSILTRVRTLSFILTEPLETTEPVIDYRIQTECSIRKESWACGCTNSFGIKHLGRPFSALNEEFGGKCPVCVDYDAKEIVKQTWLGEFCAECLDVERERKRMSAEEKVLEEEIMLRVVGQMIDEGVDEKELEGFLKEMRGVKERVLEGKRERRERVKMEKKWANIDETSEWTM